MNLPPRYLGIDFGTSGCRAVVVDGDGAVAGQHATGLPAPVKEGSGVAQEPPPSSLMFTPSTRDIAIEH